MMSVEEFHNYLSMVWYEELARIDEHKDEDHLKWAVKRRCQAEAL